MVVAGWLENRYIQTAKNMGFWLALLAAIFYWGWRVGVRGMAFVENGQKA